jgi:hypothetical protein
MMKKILIGLSIVIIATLSCKSSKDLLERTDTESALRDAVKRLFKNSDDQYAAEALPILYKKIQEKRMDKIQSLQASSDMNKWDKIIAEYKSLENSRNTIIEAPPAYKIMKPESYENKIKEVSLAAAEDYYVYAQTLLSIPGRQNALQSYAAFRKVIKYAPDYKDSNDKMQQAYDKSIVNVVVYPVEDNSFFNNNNWGNYGTNFNNEYFQQRLLRELSAENNSFAKYYSDWEIRRNNMFPDWSVYLRLRNIDLPPASNNYSTRRLSKQVQTGTDSSGRPTYSTVYASLNITRSSFIARADMEMNIRDLKNGGNISLRTFREDYRWEQETATYNGDSRALSQRDWDLVNARLTMPRREDVVNELYRKIYPQVLNSIRMAARG